jgi:hypothetical protein
MKAINNSTLDPTAAPLSTSNSIASDPVAVAETCVVCTDDEVRLFFIPIDCAGDGELASIAASG